MKIFVFEEIKKTNKEDTKPFRLSPSRLGSGFLVISCLKNETTLHYRYFLTAFRFRELARDQKTKELTADRFARFLRWLSPDEAAPGEEYERLRFRLHTYFAHRNCRFVEELADETINRVCLRIGEEEVLNKTAFVYGFAKNVYLESLRKEKHHANIDEVAVAAREIDDEPDDAHRFLDKCLGELQDENRKLILEYFSEEKQAKIDLHKQLAAKFRTSSVGLRMRIVRIKRSLQLCMQQCMTAA